MAKQKIKQLGVRISHEIIKRLDKYVMREWRAGNPEIASKYESRARLVESILYDWLNEKEKKGRLNNGKNN